MLKLMFSPYNIFGGIFVHLLFIVILVFCVSLALFLHFSKYDKPHLYWLLSPILFILISKDLS